MNIQEELRLMANQADDYCKAMLQFKKNMPAKEQNLFNKAIASWRVAQQDIMLVVQEMEKANMFPAIPLKRNGSVG